MNAATLWLMITTSDQELLNLGPLRELPEGEPTLRKAGGQRFACVRRGEVVHVLDDRCPHQGYPLSQGTLASEPSAGQTTDVLTCCWHNWKFELSTGACSFGGEAVRRFPSRVDEEGDVIIDTSRDVDEERQRYGDGIRSNLREGAMGAVMRDALRLTELEEDPRQAAALRGGLEVLARDAAQRAPFGMDHGLAMLADVTGWMFEGRVDRDAAFAAASANVSEPLTHAQERASAPPAQGTPADVLGAFERDDRQAAEGISRHLVRTGQLDALIDDALLPWLGRDLTGYGHGLIFLLKARELIERLTSGRADLESNDGSLAEVIIAALVVSIGWATVESALPGWGPTHKGVREARARGGLPLDAGYVERVLESERSAVEACLARLAEGVSPRALIVGGARAAAERITRFDAAWESREQASVTILHVSHLLTFAEAILSQSSRMQADLRARYAVQLAGFVGKLHAADGEPTRPTLGSSLEDALDRRDLAAALGTAEPSAGHYRAMAEFALHRARVLPIFTAHAVKMTETARRLEHADPESGALYRAALAAVVVPRRPERRFRQTARIASKFLADGRPPLGLY